MIGIDQDLNDFPRWIWKYINIAKLAEGGKFHAVKQAENIDARMPLMVIDVHMMAIMSALTLRKTAAVMDGDMGKQFGAAANRALQMAIEDCARTGNKPWPTPPKNVMLHEMAGHLAMAAAEFEGDEIFHAGLKDAASRLLTMAEKG